MASSSPTTKSKALGDPQRGGALFVLPRELRDQIYRLVVKGFYHTYVPQGKTLVTTIRKGDERFGILEVSKAVSEESSEIWLSESVFHFHMDFGDRGIICLPAKLTNRMKNVELRLTSTRKPFDHISTVCKAAIAPFTDAHVMRNTLEVEISYLPGTIDLVSAHVIGRLRAATGFNTIIIQVSHVCLLKGNDHLELVGQWLHEIGQFIEHMLEPTLGPATTEYLGRTGGVLCLAVGKVHVVPLPDSASPRYGKHNFAQGLRLYHEGSECSLPTDVSRLEAINPPAVERLRLPTRFMMSTKITPKSLPLPSTTTEGNPGLGILGTLPREIRDEIYQHLVKGLYLAICPSVWTTAPSKELAFQVKQRQLAVKVLSLSKAINHEAAAVHYLESTFRCCLDTSEEIVYLPRAKIDRMLNIDLTVLVGMSAIFEQLDTTEQGVTTHHDDAWSTTIRKLNATHLVRKSIHVYFQIFCSPILAAVSSKMICDLKTLVEYGTIVVEFVVVGKLRDMVAEPRTEQNKHYFEELDLLTKTVMGELEPALGPTTLSLARSLTGETGRTKVASFLTFHPQEHLAKKLEP